MGSGRKSGRLSESKEMEMERGSRGERDEKRIEEGKILRKREVKVGKM